VAVSDNRIFYQRFSFDPDTYRPVDPEVIALGFTSEGGLKQLGSIAPQIQEPYGSLVARGNRAFLSSMGNLEVLTSRNGELESSQHDLRSYGCSSSSLEVVGDQALCAQGMFGVQSIPLD
jgi:hypothetical protein